MGNYNPEVTRLMLEVEKLPFVSRCSSGASNGFIYVALRADLLAFLPEHLSVIQIHPREFTVEKVIESYTVIVDYVIDIADRAKDLLRQTKQ